jgi:hypothetical protein
VKHSPLIRLQDAQRHYDAAQAACPHWDYEDSTEAGYGCCHEMEDARRELSAARKAYRESAMIATGKATLYLSARGHKVTEVTDWPGALRFPVYPAVIVKPRGGGFGSQRTDAWFKGPDGYVWHAVNRGDSQIARCRRTKEKAK